MRESTYLDVLGDAMTCEPVVDDWHVNLRPMPMKFVFAHTRLALDVHGELATGLRCHFLFFANDVKSSVRGDEMI